MERKQNEQMEKRANLSARAKAALTPQELALLPTDQYGVPDTDALLEATARKEGEMKVLKAQEKAKEEADTKTAAAAKTAETAKAAAEEKLAATGIKDLEAFPSRVKELESRKKVGAAELEAAEDPEYLQAKAFDENRLNQETLAALNYDEEEYVNILDESRKKRGLGELSEPQKKARRAVWRRAKRLSAGLTGEPAEETPVTEPVAPSVTPAPVAPAPTRPTPQDKLKELLKQP